MAYTGAWRNQRTRVDRARPLGHPELAQLHMHTDWTPPGARPPYAAPRTDIGPEDIRDPGTAYDPVTPRQAPGNPLDHSPEGHQGWAAPGGVIGSRPGPSRATGNAARSVDRGAALRQLWRQPKGRSADDQRETRMLTLQPVTDGSRVGAFRGRNSLPENNPDGYRVGQRVQRIMNRKIPTRWRRHELRPLRPRLAAAATVSPPMAEGNQYTSPFGWTDRARSRTVQSPTERRAPRPWDEDLTDDGVTETVSGFPSFESWAL